MPGGSTLQCPLTSEGLGFFPSRLISLQWQWVLPRCAAGNGKALAARRSAFLSRVLLSNTCCGHGLTGPCAFHWSWPGNSHCRLTAGKKSPSAKQVTCHLHPCSYSSFVWTHMTTNEAWRYTGTQWEGIIGREITFLHFCSCFQMSGKVTLGSLAKTAWSRRNQESPQKQRGSTDVHELRNNTTKEATRKLFTHQQGFCHRDLSGRLISPKIDGDKCSTPHLVCAKIKIKSWLLCWKFT